MSIYTYIILVLVMVIFASGVIYIFIVKKTPEYLDKISESIRESRVIKKEVIMRDPARIDHILGLIEKIWKANPDFRFQQLIYVLQYEYSEANNQIGNVESSGADGFKKVAYDLFNLEDEQFQKYLQETIENGSWNKKSSA